MTALPAATAGFDWKAPDYAPVIRARVRRLQWLRDHPEQLPALKAFYRDHIPEFISDWGWTYEPRNVEIGLPADIPFLLFERQVEWVQWCLEGWRARRPGATEKARDCGLTWLAVGVACALCIFHDGVAIGFGSRKEDLVDKIGTMKPIFPKIRKFMGALPEEFRAGWVEWRDSPFMRTAFPQTGSLINGEAGDQVGRGDRTSIYFVDEAEHIERLEQVEMALSETTNCRVDISSVNGSANPVAQKILKRKVRVFYFDWKDDPRKGEEWYRKKCEDLDPVVVAQEIDRDRSASVKGILIPGVWVRAAIGARQKLGIALAGEKRLALDIGDEGDANAMVGGQGIEVSIAEEWSGAGSDTFATVQRAFEIADGIGVLRWDYDADGLGALVRGDARIINEQRQAAGRPQHRVTAFRGSGAVVDPEGIVEGTRGSPGDPGRTNEDYFLNHKAQAWWALRQRFYRTWRWVTGNKEVHGDEIISLDPALPNLEQLVSELSQPTFGQNGAGKMLINKRPEGQPSPNLADGCMMRYAPRGPEPVEFTPQQVRSIQARLPRRRTY